ncbi:MAG: iron-sulfur cluster repair di-iron protein [Ferruginibacter sp.]
MTNIAERTLASIVTEKYQTVAVLEKYSLDYCCKGKRTLSEACIERGLAIESISKELQDIATNEETLRMPFMQMSAAELISYILIYHHFYVKQSMPTIMSHIEKVAAKHGERFPYMIKVRGLFAEIHKEMTTHMHKEEHILFPRIIEVEKIFVTDQKTSLAKGFISMPVHMMETEHDQAGEILYEIRELTNNYEAPAEACTTFKLCLTELKAFEEDLHRHVHLENNLLFPLAKKMFEVITA